MQKVVKVLIPTPQAKRMCRGRKFMILMVEYGHSIPDKLHDHLERRLDATRGLLNTGETIVVISYTFDRAQSAFGMLTNEGIPFTQEYASNTSISSMVKEIKDRRTTQAIQEAATAFDTVSP